ncbi:AbrB/MazE/SpoVT family DNA-binding domain-containing protein [Desulfosporosinus sp. PR]|uniref:AbrB/MazE/SpoVT family DNA-binding domain-containing protein n=1 Tax=Candidatus Desulfosporosinus nitrosoreducens TaxID=3401928 RepID=UPI0027FD033B|nr:AbrB/MazE/SpoVT family DNA-binding domain-containing protein [Desulfosporosinus sp. PR]MDQ7096699.1 AbrB/MazE/SpoVT family DNA-binding domain-containing protein [Desulfosporosinus sp. PR]
MPKAQFRKSFGIVQTKRRSTITIGKEVRKLLHLADEGEVFEIIVEDGRIILEPKKLIPADQAWYWTEEWQAAEREAQEDIKARRTKRFDTVKDLMQDLMEADAADDKD